MFQERNERVVGILPSEETQESVIALSVNVTVDNVEVSFCGALVTSKTADEIILQWAYRECSRTG